MNNQELENKLEYFKGGLELIKQERAKVRSEILRGFDLENNSKKLNKITCDYIIVKQTIDELERAMKS